MIGLQIIALGCRIIVTPSLLTAKDRCAPRTVKCPISTLPLYLCSLGLASDHHTIKESSTFGHKSQNCRNANSKWAVITFHNQNNGEQTSKSHSFDCQLILVIYRDLRKSIILPLMMWVQSFVEHDESGYEHKFSFGWYLPVGE